MDSRAKLAWELGIYKSANKALTDTLNAIADDRGRDAAGLRAKARVNVDIQTRGLNKMLNEMKEQKIV